MQNLRLFLLLYFLSFNLLAIAQDDPVVKEYIVTYRNIAISEMKRTGVPASIKLAQGIHETSAGTSTLVKKSNNHFGIKCKTGWAGEKVSHTDDAPNECFRKYDSPITSYRDHSDFLKGSSRYASLFDLDPMDYAGWAYGLKKAGYATNPKYSQVIIKLIEDYNLQDYTMIALGKKDPGEIILAKQDPTETNSTVQTEMVVIPLALNETRRQESNTLTNNNTQTDKVYPEDEFKINETRVIYAKKGTPFLTIAEKYSLSLGRIFEFNDMKEKEEVEKDQLIYLMRKRKTGNNELHIVQEGETLFDIAQSEALRIESLMEYNYLKPGSKPVVGTVLYLKVKAPVQTNTAGK